MGWQWRADAGKEVCVDASGDGGHGETSVSLLLLLYQAHGLYLVMLRLHRDCHRCCQRAVATVFLHLIILHFLRAKVQSSNGVERKRSRKATVAELGGRV